MSPKPTPLEQAVSITGALLSNVAHPSTDQIEEAVDKACSVVSGEFLSREEVFEAVTSKYKF